MTTIVEAVQGSRHTALKLTLTRDDGSGVLDLTNVQTITARIKDTVSGNAGNATGAFSVVGNPTQGVAQWVYGASDVASSGLFLVQLSITYADGSVEVSLPFPWQVVDSL